MHFSVDANLIHAEPSPHIPTPHTAVRSGIHQSYDLLLLLISNF